MSPLAAPDFCAPNPTRKRRRRIMWIWHAAVVAEYQKPLSTLAKCPDLDVTLVVPRRWPERAGQMVEAEQPALPNFRLIKARTVFTGFYYIYFYPALLFHLLRYRPDIIYCYEEAHTLIAALVLLYRRLFLRHSRVFLYAAQNIEKRYPLPFRLAEQYCFARADLIVACGSRVAETLRAKGYKKALRVVALPVDVEAFRPCAEMRAEGRASLGLSEGDLVIGYAGKLVEEKGLGALWRAFADLAREHPNLHLLLAGRGPMLEVLPASAREAGLEDRLHVPGVVHNSDLPRFMNAMDIFVLPSETRPNWREQFGRAIVEAMACGVAAVGSDSGELPDVIGEAGLVFPEGDASALASALGELLSDAPLRERLAQAGRSRALALYSVDEVAAQHYRLYEEAEANL